MEALINDSNTSQIDILLIQEPPTSKYQTYAQHRQWQLYQPICSDNTKRKRSLIYVNKRLSSASHRQIRCDSPDVVTIKILTPTSKILVFSVYTPPVGVCAAANGTELQPTLDAIKQTIQDTASETGNKIDTIMAGDFNRHHPVWGNNRIDRNRMGDAEELLVFMQCQGLQNCLPRDTPTYWSLSYPGTKSTLDLTLTNVPEQVLKCHLYEESFGSDHRAIISEWNIQPELRRDTPPRLQYERTDWNRVGQQIQENLETPSRIDTREELEQTVDNLINATVATVKNHTPLARPSPYAKRWFNPDLKRQQIEHNKTRRCWQSSCATRGKDDTITTSLFEEMRRKRRKWTRDIEKAKKKHWKEFLDQANSGDFLWKAAKYAKPTDNYTAIPPLKVADTEHTDNHDKARVFMESFFPQTQLAPVSATNLKKARQELRWEPISDGEVARALAVANGRTAPGIDGLPMLIWKKIWKHTSGIILKIFRASIELGYYPAKWKTASIVVLRKLAGKRDYASPNAYRPISFLNTLGKLLEGVMAERLSHYAENFSLLPDTQFGGRPGRSPEQALLILANSIDKALRKNKALTLVAFDLKGAFNRVNKRSLDARLREKGIPSIARRWIRSFMEERRANIRFDGFSSAIEAVPTAGLAQGSPLSPILFDFFNSNLVNQPVNNLGGASAFIDDYFRWRVGKTAIDNLRKYKRRTFPASRSGQGKMAPSLRPRKQNSSTSQGGRGSS
jgi:hypothetical protein